MRYRSTFTIGAALTLALGLSLGACAARKAKDACEDYVAAAEDNCADTTVQADCGSAKGGDLEMYECLIDWAEAGCDGLGALQCAN